jgi:hypothetical protein
VGGPAGVPPAPGASPGAAARRPRAGTVLVLAALALATSPFLGGLVFGIPALVIGARARRRGEASTRLSLGLALGTVALAATAAFVLFVLRSDAFQDYVDCVQASDGVAAEREACEDRLRADLG